MSSDVRHTHTHVHTHVHIMAAHHLKLLFHTPKHSQVNHLYSAPTSFFLCNPPIIDIPSHSFRGKQYTSMSNSGTAKCLRHPDQTRLEISFHFPFFFPFFFPFSFLFLSSRAQLFNLLRVLSWELHTNHSCFLKA